jgi:transposase
MEERFKFLMEWRRGDVSVSELCRQYEVSRKTGYKWLHRYRLEGVPGLADRSRAPLCHPRAMDDEVEAAILALRARYPSWGAKKIRAYLMHADGSVRWPAASSIGELLRREGLTVARRRARRRLPAVTGRTRCGASTSRAGSVSATGGAAIR